MYLLKRIINVLLIISPLCLLFSVFASCNQNNENKKHYDFIFQRTFMLQTLTPAGAGGAFTGWLFEKLDNEQYTYYLATCEHCRLGVETQIEQYSNVPFYYGCAHSSVEGSQIDLSPHNTDYQHLLCDLKTSNDFTWVYEPIYYEEPDVVQWGVDFAVAKINFSSAILSDSSLKTRLNKLNSYAKHHNNKLIKFSTNEVSLNQKLYIGGYPANSEFLPSDPVNHWRVATDKIGLVKQNFDRNVRPYNDETKPTDDDNLDCNLIIHHFKSMADAFYTPQKYWCDSPIKYFGGGASGSLVINDKYEVMGIFRGDVKGDIRNGYPSSYQIWVDILYLKNQYDCYTDFKNSL